MSNVTIVSDEYTNIQGVAVKKIKLTEPNLKSMFEEAKKAVPQVKPVVEEVAVKEPVVEPEPVKPEPIKVEPKEKEPLYFNEEPKKDEEFEKKISEMKQETGEHYKNLGNFKIKEERKEPQVTIETYNDLYSKLKDSVIMAEEIS